MQLGQTAAHLRVAGLDDAVQLHVARCGCAHGSLQDAVYQFTRRRLASISSHCGAAAEKLCQRIRYPVHTQKLRLCSANIMFLQHNSKFYFMAPNNFDIMEMAYMGQTVT